MKKVFEGSNVEGLIQDIFAHIKKNKERENAQMSESCFILDHTMNLYVNFHEVALAQGDSYTELSEWIAKEKEGSNPKSNNRQCFKSSTNIKAKGL